MKILILGAALILSVQADPGWDQEFQGRQIFDPARRRIKQFRDFFLRTEPECTWVCRNGGNSGTGETGGPPHDYYHSDVRPHHHDYGNGPNGPPRGPPQGPPRGPPPDWSDYQNPYQVNTGYQQPWGHSHHHGHHNHHHHHHHHPDNDYNYNGDNSGTEEDSSPEEDCEDNAPKGPDVTPELTTPEAQVQPQTTINSQVQPETTINSQVQPQTTIDSQVQPQTTINPQVQPQATVPQTEQSSTPGQTQPGGTDFDWNSFNVNGATPNNTGGSGLIDVRIRVSDD